MAEKIEFLGAPMHALTMSETLSLIEQRMSAGKFTQHSVVNVAKLVHMQSDTELYQSVASCDIINIDGMGVVWGARLLGHRVPGRVAGIDLFLALIELAARNAHPVYLLGASPEVVDETRARLVAMHPDLNVAGHHHGYFWNDERAVVERIRSSGAKLLFVAISSPKKENFIHRWRDELGVSFVMGVGGSFDVVAGAVTRAPVWMQKTGLEWLYRVIQEPGRMWKRYLTTNVLYSWLILTAVAKAISGRRRA